MTVPYDAEEQHRLIHDVYMLLDDGDRRVLAPLGLRLSAAKSRVCHLDEGLDFLGFHIQRRRKRGTSEYYVYTYPSKKALASITGKVRAVTNKRGHRTLADLLRQLNSVDDALRLTL